MNIKMKISILGVSSIIIGTLIGCGGSGGGSGSGTVVWNHDAYATQFVNVVNSTLNGDVQLMKADTLQGGNYIVIRNFDTNDYQVYDITSYDGTIQGTKTFLETHLPIVVTTALGSDYYTDPLTGTRYSKDTSSSQKNLAKIAAVKQDIAIDKTSQSLRAKYGLSTDKAIDVARFAYKLKSSPQGTYNKGDYDAFMKEISGSSITDFENDVKSGDNTSLNARIEKAEQMTGMGPEGVNQLITDMFGN